MRYDLQLWQRRDVFQAGSSCWQCLRVSLYLFTRRKTAAHSISHPALGDLSSCKAGDKKKHVRRRNGCFPHPVTPTDSDRSALLFVQASSINVSPIFEWQTANSQSARADEIHHFFFMHDFNPTVVIIISFGWSLAHCRVQDERSGQREKNVPKTLTSPHVCHTLRNWVERSLSSRNVNLFDNFSLELQCRLGPGSCPFKFTAI